MKSTSVKTFRLAGHIPVARKLFTMLGIVEALPKASVTSGSISWIVKVFLDVSGATDVLLVRNRSSRDRGRRHRGAASYVSSGPGESR